MTDPAPVNPTTPRSTGSGAPTITVGAGYIVAGAGFLPDHVVTIRVTYTADNVSDYLAFSTNARGELYAELPISPATGTLYVVATDHRTDRHGACRLVWSNTETIRLTT
jgi:hypothetical protein